MNTKVTTPNVTQEALNRFAEAVSYPYSHREHFKELTYQHNFEDCLDLIVNLKQAEENLVSILDYILSGVDLKRRDTSLEVINQFGSVFNKLPDKIEILRQSHNHRDATDSIFTRTILDQYGHIIAGCASLAQMIIEEYHDDFPEERFFKICNFIVHKASKLKQISISNGRTLIPQSLVKIGIPIVELFIEIGKQPTQNLKVDKNSFSISFLQEDGKIGYSISPFGIIECGITGTNTSIPAVKKVIMDSLLNK